MKRRTLQQLIEQARRVRDHAAVNVAGATRDAEHAQRTLETLSTYLREHLGKRSGGAAQPRVDPAILRLRERFTRRLGVAIDEQTRARDTLQAAIEQRREELIGRQRRLLAFEALQTRRDAALARRNERAEQRQTDELAARAALAPSRRPDDES